MKAFAKLYSRLDETNRTNDKVAALRDYFASADSHSAAWALWFLIGKRLRAPVKTKLLRVWAAQMSEVPLWMVEECYGHVGDLAETLALILPTSNEEGSSLPLWQFVEEKLMALSDWDGPLQFQLVRDAWNTTSSNERFIYNKLITGGFRVGVSRSLVVRALAELTGVERAIIEHRLLGGWQPSANTFQRLICKDEAVDDNPARPYPFYLATALNGFPDILGEPSAWRAEWKWDGIRAQLIKRAGRVLIWSRGEEMITDRFPEVTAIAARLPDGIVLDGELLAWHAGRPLPFVVLQKRIGRTKVSNKLMVDYPVAFLAYDCLEYEAQDLRGVSLEERVTYLDKAIDCLNAVGGAIFQFKQIRFTSWYELADLREQSRERGVEGVMLKRRSSPYGVGRVRGDWWKWKIDPYSVDAVLVAAQSGHGRRSGLYTDYTFAIWQGDTLVTFAKAYSGLKDVEIAEVDRWVRRHVIARHGPACSVEPTLVFELHFEGIGESNRHKSGLAVRFPRIARWRRDKPAREADTLESMRALLPNSDVDSPE